MTEDPTLRAADLIYDATAQGPLLRDESYDLAVKVMAEGYQPTFGDLRAAITSARHLLAMDSRDWGLNRGDAWLWGILHGWDDGDGDGDGAMAEMADLHRWSRTDVERLRSLHAAVVAHQTAPAQWASVAELQAAHSELVAKLAETEAERDDYAARLKATDRTPSDEKPLATGGPVKPGQVYIVGEAPSALELVEAELRAARKRLAIRTGHACPEPGCGVSYRHQHGDVWWPPEGEPWPPRSNRETP